MKTTMIVLLGIFSALNSFAVEDPAGVIPFGNTRWGSAGENNIDRNQVIQEARRQRDRRIKEALEQEIESKRFGAEQNWYNKSIQQIEKVQAGTIAFGDQNPVVVGETIEQQTKYLINVYNGLSKDIKYEHYVDLSFLPGNESVPFYLRSEFAKRFFGGSLKARYPLAAAAAFAIISSTAFGSEPVQDAPANPKLSAQGTPANPATAKAWARPAATAK